MNTTKRTKSDLYDHKSPPRKKKTKGKICPMSGQPCCGESCRLWDEHWEGCSLGGATLYNEIRDALTDAFVDIIREYGQERRARAWRG